MKGLTELQLFSDSLTVDQARAFLGHVLTWPIEPTQSDTVRRWQEAGSLLAALDNDPDGQSLARVRELAHSLALTHQEKISDYLGGLHNG